jgi:hypothetical protein
MGTLQRRVLIEHHNFHSTKRQRELLSVLLLEEQRYWSVDSGSLAAASGFMFDQWSHLAPTAVSDVQQK